jgi:hypothetical protein
MFVTRADRYDETAEECLRRDEPLFELAVDGKPVLLIYGKGGAQPAPRTGAKTPALGAS